MMTKWSASVWPGLASSLISFQRQLKMLHYFSLSRLFSVCSYSFFFLFYIISFMLSLMYCDLVVFNVYIPLWKVMHLKKKKNERSFLKISSFFYFPTNSEMQAWFL